MFDPFNQAKLMNAHQNMRNLKPQPEKDMSLDELKRLSGSGKITGETTQPVDTQLQAKKAQYIKDNNLRPGDPEWMRVMFAKPHLTGEDPFSKK
jgi:hypothetical protein